MPNERAPKEEKLDQIITLSEWSTTGPSQDSRLKLARFSPTLLERVEQVNAEKRLEILPVRDGLRVTTSSWVGTVALGEFTLSIRPKIASGDMPTFVRYALGLDAYKPSLHAPSPLHKSGFVDLLARAMLDEVDALLGAGLFQDYRDTSATLSMPRGAPLFGEMARRPMITRLAIPCRFAHRTPELALNRLVVAALGALRGQVEDPRLRFELHSREMMIGETCGFVPLTLDLLEAAKTEMDRRTSYYSSVIRLAEFLLQGLGSAFEVQEAATLRSYLFNMNALFERFVARLCKEFGPPSIKIETQESLRTAYRYSSNPHGWQVPRLRPDIVVRRLASKGQAPKEQTNPAVLVIDTKYKMLAGKRPSPADLYQLTLYSLAFGGQTPIPSRIVFPCDSVSSSTAKTPKLDFVGFGSGQQPATIDLFALSLPEVALAIRKRDRSTLKAIASKLLNADNGVDRAVTS